MLSKDISKPPYYALAEYFCHRVTKDLPGLLQGLYLYGSSTLQDFQPTRSDIDFVAIIRHRPTSKEIKKLRYIHKHLQQLFTLRLDGIYTTEDSLGKNATSLPYCSNGKFATRGNFERNAVTWYQLRYNSLCIMGKAREELPLSISIDDVLHYQQTNIHHYWQGWIEQHSTFIQPQGWMLLHPRKVSWGVLGITRQLYTLRRRDVVSKSQAGEWALQHLPAQYHAIVGEVLALRKGTAKSKYSSIFTRRRECLEYMRYVVQEYATAQHHGIAKP